MELVFRRVYAGYTITAEQGLVPRERKRNRSYESVIPENHV